MEQLNKKDDNKKSQNIISNKNEVKAKIFKKKEKHVIKNVIIREKVKQKKKEMWKNIFYIIALACVVCVFLLQVVNYSPYNPDPSLYKEYDLKSDIIKDPIQKSVPKETMSFKIHGVDVNITKLASYDITGKVEALKDFNTNFLANFLSFSSGDMSNYISPRDLTLSWGTIAQDNNSEYIQVNQEFFNNQRTALINYKSELINKYGEDYSIEHVSNNHIIAIDNNLRSQLAKIKVTDVVRIIGYLVEIDCSNGVHWGPSSLRRNDTGGHACEIIYAEEILIMPQKNK